MKKISIITFAALIGIAATVAEPASAAEKWTLDSCVSWAIDHNLTVRSRRIQCQSAEYDITEAKDRFLPNVSGYAGQSFSFGRGLTSDNTYANNNTQNFNVGANLSLPIFQGLAGVRRISYAKANLRTAIEQLEAEKDNVELNVITQYLQVLYSREVAEVAVEQKRLSAFELDRRRTLVEQGKLAELDLYEAEAQLARDDMNVTTTANDCRLALVDLAQLLELDDIDGFDIAPLDSASTIHPWADAESVYRQALSLNHGVRASELEVEAAERNISLARTGWIPTLSFSAGLGTNYYRMGRFDNPSFSSQMRHNFSQSLGFSLSVPLFDAFSTRNNLRKARLQRVNAEIQLDESRNRLYKSIQQAFYQSDGARRKLEASAVAEESGRKAFEGVREKYNYGKATSSDYEQAQSSYVRARLEHVQALYELILRNRILTFYTTQRR